MIFIVIVVILSLFFLYTLDITIKQNEESKTDTHTEAEIETENTEAEMESEKQWVSKNDRQYLEYLDKRLVDVLDILFTEYYSMIAESDNVSESLLDRIERRLYVFPMIVKGDDERTNIIIRDIINEIRPFI